MAWWFELVAQTVDIVSAYSGSDVKKVWLDHKVRWYHKIPTV